MSVTRKIKYKNETVESKGELIQIKETQEVRGRLVLENGMVIEHSAVPVEVFRSIEHLNDDGEPVIVVQFRPQMKIVTQSK